MINKKNKDFIFKAAILTQLKKKLLISNIKFNHKLSRGQVLIKMYYSEYVVLKLEKLMV